MKHIIKKYLQLMIFALVAGCIFNATCFAEGNDTSGGGNTTQTPMAQIQDINKAINNAHSARLMMAYAWQRQSRFTLPDKFKNDFTIFFSQIKLLKNAGPCFDLEHKTKEGSADLSNMQICMSASEIYKRKIPLKLLDAKVAGLYAHEAAHLLNENEEIAVAAQEQVEHALGNSTFSFDKLKKSRSTEFLSFTGASLDGWPSIIDSDASDEIGLCDNTAEIANLISETNDLLYEEQKQYGVIGDEAYRLTSPTEDYLWEAFRTRGYIIGLTCASQTSYGRNDYEELFSNVNYNPMPINELMCKFNSPPACDLAKMPPTDIPKVSFIKRGNLEDAKAETLNMEKIRINLIESFKKSIWLND